MKLAVENQCNSVAFPMISTGTYDYPKYWAMKIAQNSINGFLGKYEDDIDVYIVLYGKDTSDYFDIERGVKSYLDFYLTDNDYENRRDFLREVEFQRSRTIRETLPFSEFVEENPLSESSGPSRSIDFGLNQEGKAGYTFSKSNKADMIVEYCIINHIYDIIRVNELLFSYG